jgi:hypothetical protein
MIVRNSMLNGEWGAEEREGEMVLKQGSDFSIDIHCEDDGFKVCNTPHNNKNNNDIIIIQFNSILYY